MTTRTTSVNWIPKVQTPSFTIAIPTFKRLDLLAVAVESALNQTCSICYEVVIVDNGADEHTREWARKKIESDSRLGYYANEQNLGMTGNWNQCIMLSRGKYISILHDDDILGPNFISSYQFAHNDSYAAFVCAVEVAPKPSGKWSTGGKTRTLHAANLVVDALSPFPGIVFKRQDAISVNGFLEADYPVADYGLWVRLLKLGPAIKVGGVQALYRVSPVQQTTTIIEALISKSEPIRLEAAKTLPIPDCICRWYVAYGQRKLRRTYARAYQGAKMISLCEKLEHKFFAASWRLLVILLS
jgi:glycosyltransferase